MSTEREGLAAEIARRCTCPIDGSAVRCPHHTQADYESASLHRAGSMADEVVALADVLFENSNEPMWSAVVIAKAQWEALADLLAARDRRVRVEALREAAAGVFYETGVQWGRTDYQHWLRARADRIEGEA